MSKVYCVNICALGSSNIMFSYESALVPRIGETISGKQTKFLPWRIQGVEHAIAELDGDSSQYQHDSVIAVYCYVEPCKGIR